MLGLFLLAEDPAVPTEPIVVGKVIDLQTLNALILLVIAIVVTWFFFIRKKPVEGAEGAAPPPS